MNQLQDPTVTRFNKLYNQLLNAVDQEESIRSQAGFTAERIDIRDHLHALRSDLAAARCAIARESGTHVCIRPGRVQ